MIYQESEPVHKPRIIALVGPTEVGKTTTIAKLAHMFDEHFEKGPGQRICIASLDYYTLGGTEKLKIFGKIMAIPVATINNYNIKKVFTRHQDETDIFLVDTIGLSPYDSRLAEMKAGFDAWLSESEVFLCISATTNPGDIKNILKKFELFNYKAVIITKADETRSIDSVIDVLTVMKKSIAFITTGQEILGTISSLREVSDKFKTEELCRATVERDGESLKYVPEKFRTVELYRAALEQDYYTLEYVPEKLMTAEFCRFTVKQSGMSQ